MSQNAESSHSAPAPLPPAQADLAASVAAEVGHVLPPGDPGFVDVTFEIHCAQGVRPISPLIYGNNYDVREVARQRWGMLRSGGNRLTAYNWENNASNAGADYLYQNDSLMGQSDSAAKTVLDFIDIVAGIPAVTVVTLPIGDYVSADKKGDGDVRASGPDYLKTRFKRNYAKKPSVFAAVPDPTDDAVYQDEFVAFLRTHRTTAKLILSLDNEPDLWSHTHAEIFPKPVTYAELWQRNHDFAKAAKEAWPGIPVLGFVSFGYSGFTNLQNASDAAGRNFVEWYLDQAKAAEKSEGKRLIDYLDLHWYPEATGGGERIVGASVTPAVIEAREQAPRSLWDPTYQEASWIRDTVGGPINLLGWVQSKIDEHYPGTEIAITEWNYGGGQHISGAIAVADVLGIFGRHGVAVASYWNMQGDEPFAYAAFRVFRNYDGRGGEFENTSVEAISSHPAVSSVYASAHSLDPRRVSIVAINKADKPRRAGIKIAHSTVYGGAKVYVLKGDKAEIVAGPSLSPVATNAFNYEMPAQSISVIVPQL